MRNLNFDIAINRFTYTSYAICSMCVIEYSNTKMRTQTYTHTTYAQGYEKKKVVSRVCLLLENNIY